MHVEAGIPSSPAAGGVERVWWYEGLYWSCWIALLVVAGLIVKRMIGA